MLAIESRIDYALLASHVDNDHHALSERYTENYFPSHISDILYMLMNRSQACLTKKKIKNPVKFHWQKSTEFVSSMESY